MMKKTWLWIALVVILAVLVWMYVKPAAPDAPIANSQPVPTPTEQVDSPVDGQPVDDAQEWEEVDQADEEIVEDAEDADEDTADTANEGEVEPIVPDSPVADSNEVEAFDGEVLANWDRYTLAAGSQVEWLGKKVWGQHNGYIEVIEGEVYVDGGVLMGGKFTMNMDSISATDIDNKGLDDTLKEWFNTDEYPTAEFVLTEATSTQVDGVLTLNGQSRAISFPAIVIVEDDIVIANAEFALDRTQWGVDGGRPAVSEFMELSFGLTWTAE